MRQTKSYILRENVVPQQADLSAVNAYQKASAPTYSELSSVAFNISNESRNYKVLVCYLPFVKDEGIISCTLEKNSDKIVFTTDHRNAIVPSGAIIDSIEFFGLDSFETKDVFSIGLGQLNSDIMFPLIQDTDSSVANERVGGYRDFISCNPNGKNIKNI